MKDRILLLVAAIMIALEAGAVYRYVGGDISLLPEYEEAGSKYLTHNGKPIADLVPWLRDQGMNAMRVRLFVDPSAYKGSDADPNACQDMDYILPLCKRIKDSGMALVLDFHYSDTWADPGKQWTPAAWAGLSDEQLYQKIYEYTKESLATLKAAGVTPDFIQPGNEISYGMLWGPVGTPSSQLKKTFMGSSANWNRLGRLLSQAIKACREECPAAGIILHTERTAQVDVQKNFYDKMKEMKVDYDIIGLSYYPYFHGTLTNLEKAITSLEQNFADKNIMIVETGYSYKWEVPGTSEPVAYPYSDAGQNQFAKDLVAMLLKHEKVNGLFWWWLEYNAYSTKLSNWYNAPLFDSTTGRACSALTTICTFADGNSGVAEVETDGEAQAKWFTLDGVPVEAPASGLHIKVQGRKAEKVLLP